MIYTREDGTFVIEVNKMPYHVIDTDKKYWPEVQQRLSKGEETQREKLEQPYSDSKFNTETWEWEDSEERKLENADIENVEYLNSTDWVIIRALELGNDIPFDIKRKRQEARTQISGKLFLDLPR